MNDIAEERKKRARYLGRGFSDENPFDKKALIAEIFAERETKADRIIESFRRNRPVLNTGRQYANS